jgi:FixJ family two-component response regulator
MNQNRINVAVVDDDESFARAIGRLLRASGFEVHTYPSAEAFLAPTTLPQPDCLVLDINLGGLSGLDLHSRLRQAGDPPPIIFVTAHDAPGVREEAERAGCAAYLLKPVPGKSIIEAINKAVTHRQGGGASRKNSPGDRRQGGGRGERR